VAGTKTAEFRHFPDLARPLQTQVHSRSDPADHQNGGLDHEFCFDFQQPHRRSGERFRAFAGADHWHGLGSGEGQHAFVFGFRECLGMSGVPDRRSFRLNKQRGKVMGVCAGISDYFGLDVTLVRVGWVIGTLVGFGSLVLIYLAIGLIAD
jgi:phage shock protein C